MPLHGSARAGVAGILRIAFMAIVVLVGLAGSMPRVEAAPQDQTGAPGEALFQTKCAACHTIGKGKLVGPDLQGVTALRDAQWLKSFIADPNQLFAANDPTAMQLLSESNNVKMPALGLTDAEVTALMAYLGRTGATSASATAPTAPAGDPTSGQRLFTGELALAKGGPSCLACHSVSGIGGLGVGALGPELTHVAQRYPGPGLAAVLGNIAFPTMAGPFTNRPLTAQEQADLAAFLVQADQGHPPVPAFAAGALTASTWRLLGIGLVGTIALTVLLAFFWPRQRQSVSARLRAAHSHGDGGF